MKPNWIITAVLVVVVGVGAFFGGMQYQKSQRTQFAQAGLRGQFARRFGANGQAVAGQIISQDNGSITVKLNDGSTKIILLSSSTVINKQATGSASDLKSGERVVVFGTNNSDGSVTAQAVQLNPQMRSQ